MAIKNKNTNTGTSKVKGETLDTRGNNKSSKSAKEISEYREKLKQLGFGRVHLLTDEQIGKSSRTGISGMPTINQVTKDLVRVTELKNVEIVPPSLRRLRGLGLTIPEFAAKSLPSPTKTGTRSKMDVSRIKGFLRSKGVYKVNQISDDEVATVKQPDGTRGFPNLNDLESAFRRVESSDVIERLPPALKQLEQFGVILPESVYAKVRGNKVKNEGPVSLDDLNDRLDGGKGVKEKRNMEIQDYFDKAVDEPNSIDTDDGPILVADMKHRILELFYAKEVDVPAGYRFRVEYRDIIREIDNRLNNNEIIALYGYYSSGVLLSDMENYGSENDGINTKGMLSLKIIMSQVRSFR